MAKTEEKVMKFVERELEKNPGIETSDLFEQAKKVDGSVASLSLRQFNARYPLQLKRRKTIASAPASRRRKAASRKKAAAPAPARRKRTKKEDFRTQVREVFLKFAIELTAAEDRKNLVRVLAKVDGYVDDTLKAAGR